jgi:hypothetical protein
MDFPHGSATLGYGYLAAIPIGFAVRDLLWRHGIRCVNLGNHTLVAMPRATVPIFDETFLIQRQDNVYRGPDGQVAVRISEEGGGMVYDAVMVTMGIELPGGGGGDWLWVDSYNQAQIA